MIICTVCLIFVCLIFATWAIGENILTAKISRSTVYHSTVQKSVWSDNDTYILVRYWFGGFYKI